MRHFIIGVTLAGTLAASINPVRAQVPFPSPAAAPPQQAVAYGSAYQRYPFNAPTPGDAYRDGQISRWELEQYEGPTPQALQGPSPNGRSSGTGSN